MDRSENLFTATLRTRARLPYLLYRPGIADRREELPLLLFLHGIGERGDDLSILTRHGPPRLIEAGRDLPFIVVAPQCPMGTSWAFELGALRALLHEIIRRHRVDTARIVVTGLSMGGFGTWHLAVENPRAFSAVVPICGGALSATALGARIGAIRHVPVRAFHGAKDTVVPLSKSKELVDALIAVGGNATLTVYPDAEHDSWTRTYDDPGLYDWMLAQKNTGFHLD
ncbi:MAG TPA: dienelactone hydrolase family protein [Spirochaetia bacterium]